MPLFYKTTNNGKFVIGTYGDYDQKKIVPLNIMHEQSEKSTHTHTHLKVGRKIFVWRAGFLDF